MTGQGGKQEKAGREARQDIFEGGRSSESDYLTELRLDLLARLPLGGLECGSPFRCPFAVRRQRLEVLDRLDRNRGARLAASGQP